jgi:hypothetical protein
MVGIVKSTDPYAALTYLGQTPISYGYWQGGQIYNNGGTLGTFAGINPGDIVSFKLDMDAGTCEILRNSGSIYTITGLTGTWHAGCGINGTGLQCTANFGATAFSYAVPSGYNSGLYAYLVQYAYWNPVDKGANVTLSGGNLGSTVTTAGGIVRSTVGKGSGKWYWETIAGSNSNSTGIANASAVLSAYPTGEPNCWTYYGGAYGASGVWNNGVQILTCATFTSGDVIGIALDASAGTCQFFKNNVSQGTVSGLAAATYYAALGGDGVGGSPLSTINFGATGLIYSPPAGFNSGLYT